MKRLLLLLISSVFALTTYSQCTFNVTKTGTTPAMDSAIDYTTDIWGLYLNSVVPIKINLIYSDLTAFGPLAITFPNGEKDFASAPLTDLWYATSLANSIATTELNPGEFDMDIYVNNSVNYYFGTDGNPPAGQYDFVSVLFHEIVHGLGGTSLSKYVAGVGSFGMLTAGDFVGFPISFPFPLLEGLPSVWDSYLINNSGDNITDTTIFPNESTSLGSQFQSNNIFFSGPNATTANGGSTPRMHAPSPFENGSSLHHFDENSFPQSSGNGLFTPGMASSEVEHSPGPILMGALEDIGWSINPTAGIEWIAGKFINVYPNPSNGMVNIDLDGQSFDLKIIDILGNTVQTYLKSGANNLNDLGAGTYIIVGKVDGISIAQRLVILK